MQKLTQCLQLTLELMLRKANTGCVIREKGKCLDVQNTTSSHCMIAHDSRLSYIIPQM